MIFLLRRPLMAAMWVIVLAALSSPLAAQQAASAAPTYEHLLQRLDSLPTRREALALGEAAQGRLRQAGALPNPSVDLELGNILGTGRYGGMASRETTLSATQSIELPSKRRARIDAARAQLGSTEIRGELARWQTASRLAQAYADAEAAIGRHALASEALSLADADARGVAALVREGREARFRQIQAQAELESMRAQVDELAANREIALARLGALAMVESPIDALGSSLLDRRPVGAVNPASQSPALRLAHAETRVAERQVTLEKKRALPDFALTAGMRRFAGDREQAFVVGIGMTLPIFDRNTGNIRAASAELRAAEARLTAVEMDMQVEAVAARTALKASESRVSAADASIGAAEEAYRLSRIGMEAGRISQLELRASRAALLSARRSAVDARLARATAEIELARIEGRIPFGSMP